MIIQLFLQIPEALRPNYSFIYWTDTSTDQKNIDIFRLTKKHSCTLRAKHSWETSKNKLTVYDFSMFLIQTSESISMKRHELMFDLLWTVAKAYFSLVKLFLPHLIILQ